MAQKGHPPRPNGTCSSYPMDDFSFNYDTESISSEEDIASESDFEERVRARPAQEIWNTEEVCITSDRP